MSRDEALVIVGGLMSAYRAGADIDPATVEAYVEDLIDLDVTAAVAAVKTLRQTSKFMPSIAEVRAAAAELTAGHLPDEAEAWTEVTAQIRAVGWTGKPQFSHPAIAQAVEAMGWRELCGSTNQVADRAHFLTLYRTGRGRIERERAVSPEVRALAAAVAERYALPAPPGNVRPIRPLGRTGIPAPVTGPVPPDAQRKLAELTGRVGATTGAIGPAGDTDGGEARERPAPRVYTREEFEAAAATLGLSEAELRGTPEPEPAASEAPA